MSEADRERDREQHVRRRARLTSPERGRKIVGSNYS